MITIDLGTDEYYDGKENTFISIEYGKVDFEYSLKVIYEWEGKWKKPFLKGSLTNEETIDFYMRMALQPVDKKAILKYEVIEQLADYIADKSTATIFSSVDEGQNGNKNLTNSKGKIYTAEELYALMFMNHIPLEFENRNFNRLLTVLRIIGNYNNPPKKMSKQDIYRQNAELNKMRKEQLKSKG